MASPDRKGPVTVVDVANAGRVSLQTRPIPTSATPRPTKTVTSDADHLSRYLFALEQRIDELSALTAGNIFSSGVLIRNIPMVAGTGKLVEHRLRRNYVGWVVTRLQALTATKPSVFETALPTGRLASQWLQLECPENATLDILVF